MGGKSSYSLTKGKSFGNLGAFNFFNIDNSFLDKIYGFGISIYLILFQYWAYIVYGLGVSADNTVIYPSGYILLPP